MNDEDDVSDCQTPAQGISLSWRFSNQRNEGERWGAFNSFEVTSDVQAWASGAPNNGWGIIPWPGGGNGWGFAISEAAEPSVQ